MQGIIFSFVMTSSAPCEKRGGQLIEPIFMASLQLFRSRAAAIGSIPSRKQQDEETDPAQLRHDLVDIFSKKFPID